MDYSYGTVLVLSDTLGAVDRVDGLFPTGVFLGSGRQTILLIQVELEPHSESVQLPLLNDREAEPLDLPGGETFQFLKYRNRNITAKITKTFHTKMLFFFYFIVPERC